MTRQYFEPVPPIKLSQPLAAKDAIAIPVSLAPLLNFYDLPTLGKAMNAIEFNRQEQMRMLWDIARNSQKDADRIKALQTLNDIIREVAKANGLLVEVSASETHMVGDSITRREASITSIMTNLVQENTNAAERNDPENRDPLNPHDTPYSQLPCVVDLSPRSFTPITNPHESETAPAPAPAPTPAPQLDQAPPGGPEDIQRQ